MSEKIELIVQGVDFGMCHAVNESVVKCFEDGIMTETSLLVPPPWFIEAVHICKENPEIPVGVHLDLCAEWYPYRWKPVLPTTEVLGLVDREGYFYRTNKELLENRHVPAGHRGDILPDKERGAAGEGEGDH